MDHEQYLARIGLEPDWEPSHDTETLARLGRAHVRTTPFETLSITGDPFSAREGEGVSLSLCDRYEKIVERGRGGFCYELNGLFGWLLGELGFDIERRAAMVVTDGEARPPANHLTHVVTLDRRYLTDVGLGIPTMRGPLLIDGTPTRPDAAGVIWRVVESDRPDADFVTQYRKTDRSQETNEGDEAGENDENSANSSAWTDRYVFRDVSREPGFFDATCEYLASAPESPFTGSPIVTIATDRGHLKLEPERLTRLANGERTVENITPEEWYIVLDREFGIRYDSE